jgi:hypothetical protein
MSALTAIRDRCLAALASTLLASAEPTLYGVWHGQSTPALKAFWRQARKQVKRPLIVLRAPDAGGTVQRFIGREIVTVNVLCVVQAESASEAERLLNQCRPALESAGGRYQQDRDTTAAGDVWTAGAIYQYTEDLLWQP